MSDLETLVQRWQSLGERIAELREERDLLEQEICRRLGPEPVTLTGIGTIRRRSNTIRRRWDSEALLRTVLDSRLVDPLTGEIKDETPLDKVLHVWRLDAPRVTALQNRGIDADEFCETERRGWKLEIQ